ncbi:MAG: Uma2 family endonuclease [Acidobacteria bacterium]|nr:Uma2 family endonuclease [Acidobacteriota bacterium]
MSDEQFFDFCARNPEYRIERTAEGRILVMSGTGGKTGNRNMELSFQLQAWSKQDGRGVAFDSSTLFRLPNTAMRSPDAAWVSRKRLATLSEREKEQYLPLCPEFVVELTSPSDRLPEVEEKMREWMANGCLLGWLLHAEARHAHVYRPGGVEVLKNPPVLQADEPLAGFALELKLIWDPGW